ncbi:hypothetical protein BK749_14070 [Bacillus thuringiensis serovar vazensis]|uniref:AAA+ ATPase domain-containing protein n=1 Tax=Bacillus thuringiensis serovar vazensis TaxID=180867 RepID=A0A243CYH2_BACTU|nr:AAA family ATPase [Bacillus thuringiensis]OTY75365.1 hypothetical protein BK749_14070 [Bacillus thuringiensis serovar vazensis]
MEIEIFNGPKGEFIKQVPTEGSFTLTNLVRFIDSKDSKDPSLQEGQYNYDTLVIHSDEYSGVADFFIEGFLIYCIHFSEKFGYTKILLHNPPAKILNQIESANLQLEIEIINYEYPRLELANLSKIKRDFENVIYGQTNVKDELLRTLYSLTNPGIHKPTVVMLYGPSSVGKTETAKFVNKIINPNQKLFRKQLSMFHNESFMNYIFGDKSNSFAKDLLDRETNVILLDEFDKAHPMFYSAFYQLFDEGIYTDKFYEVNLENTIIFCTSNYHNEKEIKEKLGDPIFSRFNHFIKYVELSKEAKEAIIETVYDEELLKFNEEDMEIIKGWDIKDNLKRNISSLNNAREIRKIMIQMMTYPLIEKL